MSHRDIFTGVRHGLYVNGVKIEDLNGYYYNNERIGIPDGCYNDGEVLSQFGAASFTMSHNFTAHGIVGPAVLEGYATMTADIRFSAYGTTVTPMPVAGSATMRMSSRFKAYGQAVGPAPTREGEVIEVRVPVCVNVGKETDNWLGGVSSYPFELPISVKVENK